MAAKLYAIFDWEGEGKSSVHPLTCIVEPRKPFENYEAGQRVLAKWGKSSYFANIGEIGDKKTDLEKKLLKASKPPSYVFQAETSTKQAKSAKVAAQAAKKKKVEERKDEVKQVRSIKKREKQLAIEALDSLLNVDSTTSSNPGSENSDSVGSTNSCVGSNHSSTGLSSDSDSDAENEHAEDQPNYQLTSLLNAKGYATVAQKQPRKMHMHEQAGNSPSCDRCTHLLRENKQLREELDLTKQQLQEERKKQPRGTSNNVLLVEEHMEKARPKPGKVADGEVSKYQMKELVPGSGIFLYEEMLHIALNKFKNVNKTVRGKQFTKDGRPAARYLMKVLFSKDELENGTLSEVVSSKNNIQLLDQDKIEAIHAFCCKNCDTSPAAIKQAMYSKVSSMRWKKNKHVVNIAT